MSTISFNANLTLTLNFFEIIVVSILFGLANLPEPIIIRYEN